VDETQLDANEQHDDILINLVVEAMTTYDAIRVDRQDRTNLASKVEIWLSEDVVDQHLVDWTTAMALRRQVERLLRQAVSADGIQISINQKNYSLDIESANWLLDRLTTLQRGHPQA